MLCLIFASFNSRSNICLFGAVAFSRRSSFFPAVWNYKRSPDVTIVTSGDLYFFSERVPNPNACKIIPVGENPA